MAADDSAWFVVYATYPADQGYYYQIRWVAGQKAGLVLIVNPCQICRTFNGGGILSTRVERFFGREKIGHCHVVPNCFETPISKFPMQNIRKVRHFYIL